jgi:hypothetical protein
VNVTSVANDKSLGRGEGRKNARVEPRAAALGEKGEMSKALE